MTQYVGLDVSMKETKLHVLDEAGVAWSRTSSITSSKSAQAILTADADIQA